MGPEIEGVDGVYFPWLLHVNLLTWRGHILLHVSNFWPFYHQLYFFHQERLYHLDIFITLHTWRSFWYEFLSSCHPVVSRHRGWGWRDGVEEGAPNASSPRPLTDSIPPDARQPLAFISSFLASLDMTISFVMRFFALISNFFFPYFNFIWGFPLSMPDLLVKTIQTSFPFLECWVLQHHCARVLYGAVPEAASWTELPSSYWSLRSCCILSSMSFFFL